MTVVVVAGAVEAVRSAATKGPVMSGSNEEEDGLRIFKYISVCIRYK